MGSRDNGQLFNDHPAHRVIVVPSNTKATIVTQKSFKRSNEAYPPEMRRQLWPLCCGASILSGFKAVGNLSPEELVASIDETLNSVPDLQVYGSETINPQLTFLTLNGDQMKSKAILTAIDKAGFVQFGASTPRNSGQGFFYRDPTKTFKLTAPNGTVIDPVVACGC